MITNEYTAQIEQKEKELRALNTELLELKRKAYAMPVRDYTLTASDGSTVKLSEAFGDKDQLVLIHNMGFRCSYCTMWADGFNSLYPYVQRRAAFVLLSNDPPEKQTSGAAARGWTFPMLSAQGTSLFNDLGFQDGDGSDWPGVSTLVKDPDGSLRRASADIFGPGDNYNAAWHLMDLLERNDESIEPVEGISDQVV
jgi:predicted dithiol-disulfide oxidoreductase (DUF899 family)